MEIFKSPTRPASQTNALLSNYVDYTPRRIQTSSSFTFDKEPNLEDVPNSITYAKQRRSNFYHRLALEADEKFNENLDYMDSPAVRRTFSLSEHVVDVEDKQYFHAHQSKLPPLTQRTNWTINDFLVGHNLGTGKFGTVYIAREKRSGQIVALKILKKQELEMAGVVPFLKREIEIQGHLNHPNITRLYGYFHNKENIYLVLEYAGDSDLYTCLASFKRFTEAETVNYIIEIADALTYMHRLGVFHRDIKLENILISKDGTLKIADFGWAVYDPKPRRNTFCGTLDYLPPEMVKNQTHNESVDSWALGILCYELLVGKPPFEKETSTKQDPEDTYERILEAKVEFPDDISMHARSFISKLLQKEPLFRCFSY
ncbi:kinase-like domain-containing protein [Parasitella parasitica]|nr:kinase-like domain-containing protein [Parasitella parasitica]